MMLSRSARLACLLFLCSFSPARGATSSRSPVVLHDCRPDGVTEDVQCGSFLTPENLKLPAGRLLKLKIVVIPAHHPHRERGPIFVLVGGPGQTATELASDFAASSERENQDVVLFDQRGTSDDARLDCPSPGSDQDLEAYLTAPFSPDNALKCLAVLRQKFDLTQYSTAAFVRDIDTVRRTMGYQRINLSGGSGGTYVALAYMRAYPRRVRTAMLTSLVDSTNRLPLYHAQSAQYALDQLFTACAVDPGCHGAFPNLSANFKSVLARVRAGPVQTVVRNPSTGAAVKLSLTEPVFVDGVRVMMYSGEAAHRLPLVIEQARAGDFSPFAEAALRSDRGVYAGLRMGLNYVVTCGEFTNRIHPDEIEPLTRDTFLGAWRVTGPKGDLREVAKDVAAAKFLSTVPLFGPGAFGLGRHGPCHPPILG